MEKKIYLFAISLFCVSLQAAVIKPFDKIFQKTQRGGIVFLSNVAMYCNVADTAALPPAAGRPNNGLKSYYVDRDGDPSTFMSSSDSMDLKSCSDISYAGLFWGGLANQSIAGWSTKDKIKIKTNSIPYVDVTADETVVANSSLGTSYHCYKDLTSFFKQLNATNLRLTVANIVGIVNTNTDGGSFGGWNLVIAYRNESDKHRQLTVYKGLTLIDMDSPPVDFSLNNFITPAQGPVTFELGVFGYEGDRSDPYIGDQLLVGDGKKFANIFDKIHTFDNIFNSTISRDGVLTPYRIPSYNCNFSIDANVFAPDNSAKNYLGNNATSLYVRQMTTRDGYLTQAFSLAVDALSPDNRLGMRIRSLKGGDGSVVQPGDTLEYTLFANNVGTDISDSTYVLNKLEGNAKYVPNSIQVKKNNGVFVSKTDLYNDDQAEFDTRTKTVKVRIGDFANKTEEISGGGSVQNSLNGVDSTVIKFRVTATDNCMDLKCDNVIDNHAFVYGTGHASKLLYESDRVPSFFDGNTCTIKDISNKSSVIIFSDCTIPDITSNSPVCEGKPLVLTAPYSPNAIYTWTGPNGFSSFEQNPVVENPVTANSGTYSLKLTLKDTNCQTLFSTSVVVNPSPKANAGTDVSTCSKSTTLNGIAPDAGVGTWSLVSGPGVVIIKNINNPKSEVSFPKEGVYTFKWSIPDGEFCASRPDSVSYTVGLGCYPTLENEHHLILNDSVATGCVIGSKDKATDGSKLIVGDVVTPTPPSKTYGTFVIDKSPSGSGCYTYTPKPGFVGIDTVVVSVCDLLGRCSNDTVFISVLGNQEKSTDKLCSPITGDLTPDDTGLNKQMAILPRTSYRTKTGVFSIDKFGKYTYVVDCDKAKTTRDTVIVEVCDLLQPTLCIDDTIFININSKPIALPDTYKDLTGDLSQNDVNSLDGPNKWFIETQPTEGSVKIDSITGKFVFTPPYPDFQGSVTFTYRIVDKDGDYSIATVNLNIPVLFVPEGFSPNGDGKHDKFVITNIESYPKNTMTILNRWGNKVYEAKPYTNSDAWDGTNQYGLRVGGDILPVGTYFYILDLGNGFKTLKGTIYLSR